MFENCKNTKKQGNIGLGVATIELGQKYEQYKVTWGS